MIFTVARIQPMRNPKSKPNTAIIAVFCKPVNTLLSVPGLVNLFQNISKSLIIIC